MAYTSPKTGAKVNPGKRKKLPKSKVSKKTQQKNRKKIARFGIGMVEDAKHSYEVMKQKKRRRSLIAKKNAVKKSNKKK